MKSTFKKLLPFAVVGVLSGATTVGALQYFRTRLQQWRSILFHNSSTFNTSFAGMNTGAVGDDFVKAAKTTVPAVVTIKNYQSRTSSRASEQDLFDFSSEILSVEEASRDKSSRFLIICHREWVQGNHLSGRLYHFQQPRGSRCQ